MKTKEEYKDEVAMKRNFPDWQIMIAAYMGLCDNDERFFNKIHSAIDEAMELYAAQKESKWISACKYTEMDKARFWAKVKQTQYCWEWDASINNSGYGVFRMGGNKSILAHRVAYEIINGEIDNDNNICHKCDNPKCVNPDHLFSGTQADNMKDMCEKNRHRIQGRCSKHIGVSFRKDTNKWFAYVYINGKYKKLRSFFSEIEARDFREKYITDNNLVLLIPNTNKFSTLECIT